MVPAPTQRDGPLAQEAAAQRVHDVPRLGLPAGGDLVTAPTTETAVLSGWCSPPGRRHTRDHAECQRRIDDGLVDACDCPDHNESETT